MIDKIVYVIDFLVIQEIQWELIIPSYYLVMDWFVNNKLLIDYW